MSRDLCLALLLVVGVAVCLTLAHGDHDHDHDHAAHDHRVGDQGGEGDEGEDEIIDKESLEYQKGSLCGYCDYCKFCKLCDEQCPCEKGPGRPNCHMCKYCRYCYLCKVCDTVCQPGGIIDMVTSKIFNSLPKINREEVDKDITGVKSWIDKKKDEL